MDDSKDSRAFRYIDFRRWGDKSCFSNRKGAWKIQAPFWRLSEIRLLLTSEDV